MRAVQCNILDGGWPYEVRGQRLFSNRAGVVVPCEDSFTPVSYPSDRPATGDPGSAFGRQMQTVNPNVIGMQEVASHDVDRLRDLLGGAMCRRSTAAALVHLLELGHGQPAAAEEVEVIQEYVDPDSHRTTAIQVLKQVFVHLESQKHARVRDRIGATTSSW
jgi:hypothetical protein